MHEVKGLVINLLISNIPKFKYFFFVLVKAMMQLTPDAGIHCTSQFKLKVIHKDF